MKKLCTYYSIVTIIVLIFHPISPNIKIGEDAKDDDDDDVGWRLGDQDFLERKILQHLKHLANALYLPFLSLPFFIALKWNENEYKKILNLG